METDERDIEFNKVHAVLRKYGKTSYEYTPPIKTISDYESEIVGLEKEIEIAKNKINKLKIQNEKTFKGFS